MLEFGVCPEQALPNMLLRNFCWKLKLLIHTLKLPVEIRHTAYVFLKINPLSSMGLFGKSRYH